MGELIDVRVIADMMSSTINIINNISNNISNNKTRETPCPFSKASHLPKHHTLPPPRTQGGRMPTTVGHAATPRGKELLVEIQFPTNERVQVVLDGNQYVGQLRRLVGDMRHIGPEVCLFVLLYVPAFV